MSAADLLDVGLRFADASGEWVSTSLGEVDVAPLLTAAPARGLRSRVGQRNYCGWHWSSTTGSHVGYESLLERDRLWMADFDPWVHGIVSQPFWLTGRDGHEIRRHAPDFLLTGAEQEVSVVDVKPPDLLNEPEVAEVFAWTGRLCAARGWRYEVWSGVDPAVLRNVRYVGAGRRREFVPEATLAAAMRVRAAGRVLSEVEAEVVALGHKAKAVRLAALAMIWHGDWVIDMTVPLSSGSVVRDAARCEVSDA